jgi:hypothetical protein
MLPPSEPNSPTGELPVVNDDYQIVVEKAAQHFGGFVRRELPTVQL